MQTGSTRANRSMVRGKKPEKIDWTWSKYVHMNVRSFKRLLGYIQFSIRMPGGIAMNNGVTVGYFVKRSIKFKFCSLRLLIY